MYLWLELIVPAASSFRVISSIEDADWFPAATSGKDRDTCHKSMSLLLAFRPVTSVKTPAERDGAVSGGGQGWNALDEQAKSATPLRK
jgi:hypothetical protein